jgi:histidinol-phosphate aminotransferase
MAVTLKPSLRIVANETGAGDLGIPAKKHVFQVLLSHATGTADNQSDAVAIAMGRPRTLLLRTFSKAYGLAGVRAGYGIAEPSLISAINQSRPPFNCNSLAQVAGAAALDDQEFLRRSRALVARQLPELHAGFARFGCTTWPSQTNFVLVDFKQPFDPLFEKFLAEGVILRPMGGYGLPNCARVNIGTEAEHALLWAACARVL